MEKLASTAKSLDVVFKVLQQILVICMIVVLCILTVLTIVNAVNPNAVIGDELNTVDIGLAQLAMHSAFETAGARDTEYMVKALRLFYEKSILMEKDGVYKL